jgi:hemerythrin superfamily protein
MDLQRSTSAESRAKVGQRATDVLREDHAKVSALFERYERASSRDKQGLIKQLSDELEVHAQVEEEIFYPRVRGEAPDLVENALEGHQEIRDCLAELKQPWPSNSECDVAVKNTKEVVQDHVEEEETKLFPLVESRLADALASIGIELQQRKNELAAMRQASV